MREQEKGWTMARVRDIYEQPFQDLLQTAHHTHRSHHSANTLQLATLLSIKTGACPENCGYCSQSGHHKTHVEKEKLLACDTVIARAKAAKDAGATRFCMGAAWSSPPEKAMPELLRMVKEVSALGLETCMTLGGLTPEFAVALKSAGLDFYNHNIDTSPSYYPNVVTTRVFDDRLKTLDCVRQAGIQVCCGGIVGLGETRADRIEFLLTLANMNPPPESVPINRLIPVKGTPLANAKPVDGLELVRTVATARIVMPHSVVRLTAGRAEMSDELQALCFFAGVNAVFVGETLLTEENPRWERDQRLFESLGLQTTC